MKRRTLINNKRCVCLIEPHWNNYAIELMLPIEGEEYVKFNFAFKSLYFVLNICKIKPAHYDRNYGFAFIQNAVMFFWKDKHWLKEFK